MVDFRAGAGKIQNKLESIVVPENKEVFMKGWGHVERAQEPM